MSQIPTNNDIPSNSFKAQEQREAKEQQNEKPEVVPFDGETSGARRKQGKFLNWFRKMFLSDRKPSEILMDVLNNQIVPGFKDNVRNGVVSTIDNFIYENAAPPSANKSNNTISYNNVYRNTTAPKPQPSQAQNTNDVQNGGFENPCFRSRMDAERFLNGKMKAYDYPTLSVHTLYMMRNKHIDYGWDAYGWNREEVLSWDPAKIIVHINSKEWPWMLNLPQAHLIS